MNLIAEHTCWVVVWHHIWFSIDMSTDSSGSN